MRFKLVRGVIVDIDSKEIIKLANLSRLKLDSRETDTFKTQLVKILDYVAKLDELDLDNVKPAFYNTQLKNVFREDILKSSYPQKTVLDLSPSNVNGFFKVSKIIE
ncbi:MAG: Asp-tRNA(Asn)/Glu-tRNA(Gln) amidotransferase subunit GatC [Candidatus Scalindua sp. AMX11]|nr:MAG: Asp-tRNA(Asn)/Glu-tRNA(Gln) amidotransferase subunit GatC [Candidatus Scalindua sp.]RZV71446.1 MAG: Asp-tRNA(Asn)/Glu-tRNA(Gln) amidotransferase subunit GatC [Candidatus Scalindua sp. SCAELEC01]TDE64290.1 MAG: Asp-tRNA(Asn)/Glu-tRNA(Gln) amidotransferase subunit GatC [Candidatus Scalindua sp. AMX11]